MLRRTFFGSIVALILPVAGFAWTKKIKWSGKSVGVKSDYTDTVEYANARLYIYKALIKNPHITVVFRWRHATGGLGYGPTKVVIKEADNGWISIWEQPSSQSCDYKFLGLYWDVWELVKEIHLGTCKITLENWEANHGSNKEPLDVRNLYAHHDAYSQNKS